MKWRARIERAERNGGHTAADMRAAKAWVTCACGEQDLRIPRYFHGCPKDHRLAVLGDAFFRAVEMNKYGRERHILNLINERASEILAEIDNEHST